jgi:hypothetical protein
VSEGDGAVQLLASARARMSAAAADLAVPAEHRLTDRERTTFRSLLGQLVRSVEDELRAGLLAAPLPQGLQAAFSSARVEIAMPLLAERTALGQPALIDLLLRRTEEHRLQRSASAESALLIELAGDTEESVARNAMALLIAQSGRLDGFRDPVIPRADLPAELEHLLVWTVAAALRRYMVTIHKAVPTECDAALSAAAARVLARHDEGETVDARAMHLALALRSAGRLEDDALLHRSATEGSLPLFLALLALRTGLAPASVWEVLSAASGLPLLLRAAGVSRDEAASALLAWGIVEALLPQALASFDGTSAEAARAVLSFWAVDPGYRAAVGRLMQ